MVIEILEIKTKESPNYDEDMFCWKFVLHIKEASSTEKENLQSCKCPKFLIMCIMEVCNAIHYSYAFYF